MYHIDLAYGDATNKTLIIENQKILLSGTAEATARPLDMMSFSDVPAGSTLYVRGTCSGTSVTGFYAKAYGIGG